MIKQLLYRVVRFLRAVWNSIYSFFARLGWKKSLALIIVALLIVWGGFAFLRSSAPAPIATSDTKGVEVLSVAELAQGSATLSVAGTVQSQSEATVNSEKAGQVLSLNYALGDYVTAGSVIAQIDNASERAALAQAQASVDAATAGANVSQTTLAAAQAGAVSALLAAYGAVDSTVRGSADTMFSNPESNQPQLNVSTSDSQAKISAENGRLTMAPLLAREHARSTTLSISDDLSAELTTTQAELRGVRDFFDTLIRALNSGIATQNVSETTLATYKSTATVARATITSTISALVSAQQALDTATKNTSTTGAASATQASLAAAQATLASARANLERTIVRAPISGTINSLSLKRGDYTGLGPVVTIANNNALEVIAYVTQNDSRQLSVGAKATIDTDTAGVITRLAPAIDPVTKKIEVRIGITGKTSLINGQSVSVVLVTTQKQTTTPLTRITIPLAALKITSEGMSVFTVNASSSVLEANPVTIGELLGDRVVITSGLTPDMKIVTDARGLRAGQEVLVK